jgi:hypothetical protein
VGSSAPRFTAASSTGPAPLAGRPGPQTRVVLVLPSRPRGAAATTLLRLVACSRGRPRAVVGSPNLAPIRLPTRCRRGAPRCAALVQLSAMLLCVEPSSGLLPISYAFASFPCPCIRGSSRVDLVQRAPTPRPEWQSNAQAVLCATAQFPTGARGVNRRHSAPGPARLDRVTPASREMTLAAGRIAARTVRTAGNLGSFRKQQRLSTCPAEGHHGEEIETLGCKSRHACLRWGEDLKRTTTGEGQDAHACALQGEPMLPTASLCIALHRTVTQTVACRDASRRDGARMGRAVTRHHRSHTTAGKYTRTRRHQEKRT